MYSIVCIFENMWGAAGAVEPVGLRPVLEVARPAGAVAAVQPRHSPLHPDQVPML